MNLIDALIEGIGLEVSNPLVNKESVVKEKEVDMASYHSNGVPLNKDIMPFLEVEDDGDLVTKVHGTYHFVCGWE